MLQSVGDFFRGLSAHISGIRFAFEHKAYLGLIFVPFVLTLILYGVAISLFSGYGEVLAQAIWSFDPGSTSQTMGVVHSVFEYFIVTVAYIIVFAIMYFLFMVIANILASPLYDVIVERMRHIVRPDIGAPESRIGIVATVVEEVKKAMFLLIVPLALFFVPVIGQVLSLIAAMLFLAWDFVDFSLSKDVPDFRSRLGAVWSRKFALLGFGVPLLIPVLNLFLFPFAILGSALLYLQTIKKPTA
ncbi:EI24 domain-containing protein [Desulfovibrio inopinatus]|uniref:EI24 domain-containing protein n=1 Tax=Desulfovibrio inopinatus TaxID=102109 RepID=UPI00040F4AFF|nr:EI24 domain-containing protein [Desulfovibrio inopinatus]